MPIYRYQCECGAKEDVFRKIADRDDAPLHCSVPMSRMITPPMIAVFNGYQSVAAEKESGERPFIRSRGEHEAFLARNGYEEVGTDKSMAPPSREEVMDKAASTKPNNIDYSLNVDTMEASR